ncbi:MAG TPA: dockerin type I domain-containing protein [Phycisphaerae bacterium]|nr:dockerin type I domain-containing protein [Phycisphaerae bacterium]
MPYWIQLTRVNLLTPLSLPLHHRKRGFRVPCRYGFVCLVALAMAFAPSNARGDESFTFPSPSDDRWHYPFNPLPGTRSAGSTFGTVGDRDFMGRQRFNERDGVLIFAWRTHELIPLGAGAENYRVQSIKITLVHEPNADWSVDLTPDEWFTYDVNADTFVNADGIPRGQPGDTDGESDDADPGRPFELFGAGFDPGGELFDETTWTETSFFQGWNQQTTAVPRNPFPFVYQDATLAQLHCEDNVAGHHNAPQGVTQFTPTPWATGRPIAYTPSNQPISFEIEFEIDLSQSCGEVNRYFQDQLDRGRIIVIVTSLSETFMQAGSGFPTFYLNTGTPGENPHPARLEITLAEAEPGDIDADGDVDSDDVSALLVALLNPNASPPAHIDRADLNSDEAVNGEDIQLFIAAYLGGGC